jgi:hypothetical protein
MVRRVVASRAKYRCEHCHAPVEATAYTFHIDHIKPKTRGGSSELDNLAYACAPCNLAKQDKTMARDPRTGKVTRLFHPRKDVWSRHFRWNKDFNRIYGRTPVGRATVAALDMNNSQQQGARGFWHQAGLIP